jgi:ABC-type amino acid transport system permease subunit
VAVRTQTDLLSVVGFLVGVLLGFALSLPQIVALGVVALVLAIIGLLRGYTPLLVALFAGSFVGFVLDLVF